MGLTQPKVKYCYNHGMHNNGTTWGPPTFAPSCGFHHQFDDWLWLWADASSAVPWQLGANEVIQQEKGGNS